MAYPGLCPGATFSRRCRTHLVERQILTRTFKRRHANWPQKRLWPLRHGSRKIETGQRPFASKPASHAPADSISDVPLTLETSLQFVKGIGPRIAKSLQDKRIATVEDLLYHLPFRYEDRLRPQAIEELVPGEMASLIGEVRGMNLMRTRRMPIFEMTVSQGLGKVKCMWFHGTYLKDRFKAGQWVALYGKVEASRSSSNLKMIQPQVEVLPDDHDDEESKLLEVGRITPVYESLGNKLASRWQRRILRR
jgi:RecG-like helicase